MPEVTTARWHPIWKKGVVKIFDLLLRQASRGAAADMDGPAALLFGLMTTVFPYRKRVILRNGQIALGLKGEALEQFVLGFYTHFSNLIAEIIAGFAMSAEQIWARMQWDGDDFDHSLATEPLTFALTSHQGNWEWQLIGCGLRFRAHLLGAYQPLSSPYFDRLMQAYRAKGGAHPTAQLQIMRQLAKFPENGNAVLALVSDQAPPVSNAKVLSFLGTKTGFPTGPQTLTARLKAPAFYLGMTPGVLPHTYRTRMIRLTPGAEIEEYVRLLEEDIRAYPYTYLWSHNRFKHSYTVSLQ